MSSKIDLDKIPIYAGCGLWCLDNLNKGFIAADTKEFKLESTYKKSFEQKVIERAKVLAEQKRLRAYLLEVGYKDHNRFYHDLRALKSKKLSKHREQRLKTKFLQESA